MAKLGMLAIPLVRETEKTKFGLRQCSVFSVQFSVKTFRRRMRSSNVFAEN
jgi:hypothetical protein